MSKRSLPFAVLFISVFLYADPSFSAASQNSALKRQDQPCPSIVRKFPNLDLKTISADALPYLRKYFLPAADGAAFCRYLERIQHDHEVKVEEGLLDMMGDYFLTTQKIETGYYFSYKIGSPIEKYRESFWMAPLRKANKPIYFSGLLIQTRMPRGRHYLKNKSKIFPFPTEEKALSNSFGYCLKSPGSSIPGFNSTLDRTTTVMTAMALWIED